MRVDYREATLAQLHAQCARLDRFIADAQRLRDEIAGSLRKLERETLTDDHTDMTTRLEARLLCLLTPYQSGE